MQFAWNSLFIVRWGRRWRKPKFVQSSSFLWISDPRTIQLKSCSLPAKRLHSWPGECKYLLVIKTGNCLPIWSLRLDCFLQSYRHEPQTPCEFCIPLNMSYSIRKANSQAIIAFHHSALLSLQRQCITHCWFLQWWCHFVLYESAMKHTQKYMNKDQE